MMGAETCLDCKYYENSTCKHPNAESCGSQGVLMWWPKDMSKKRMKHVEMIVDYEERKQKLRDNVIKSYK